jgi:hypothetical protein
VSARRKSYQECRRRYDRDFERHELRVGVEGPKVFAFTLRRPAEWMYGVEILFTPVGIVMHGDFTPPSHRGPCGAYMKDLAWFAAEMDPDYLAGKFLEKGWTREGAEDHIRDNIESLRSSISDSKAVRDKTLARCTRLEAMVNNGEGLTDLAEYEATWAQEWYEDTIGDAEWVYPDRAYDPAGMAALATIHACFRRLFWTRYETIERVNDGFVLTERAKP